ncbi:MAG: SulP family inorganic anion transporter [Pirellulales bacterium]|nr:SulP family inorganic anion transporter [Pirellulales bacterium]
MHSTNQRSPLLSWRQTLGSDLLASVVVTLVALPLCMGIALAVGAPMSAGLVAGVIGGIVVGAIGGAPLQVSGPAAGLIVIVIEVLARYGTVDGQFSLQRGMLALSVAVTLAGLMQLAAGWLRLGQWFRAVSPAVIDGMLAGIGILIVATQIHLMVDDPTKRAHGLDYLLSIPQAIEKGLYPLDDSQHHRAARIGVITIGVILLWSRLPWKKLRYLPAPLVAVATAAAIANWGGWKISYVQFHGGLAEGLTLLNPLAAPQVLDYSLLLTSVAIAFVASAETLLCATAVDQLHTGPRTRYDRELAAQGVGNFLSGLLGGLPITGVIVRSATNVQAGAKTRLSAMLHGVWLLLLVAAFPGLLELVPQAALAAVLVYTGVRLVNLHAITGLWKQGRAEVLIYLATVAGIVIEDLLTGVAIGVVLSAIRILWIVTRMQIKVRHDNSNQRIEVGIRGNATFLRLPRLAGALENIEPGTTVTVNLERLSYVDHACAQLLESWAVQHEAAGGHVEINYQTLEIKLRGKKQADSDSVAIERPAPRVRAVASH